MSSHLKAALKIAGAYVAVSVLYIVGSDRLIELVADGRSLSFLQTFKGTAFVVVTGGLLFWLLFRQFRNIEDAQDHLRQVEKMEALGHLTGGIAHDFNNMLLVILNSFSMIHRGAKDGETGKMAAMGYRAAKRASNLTNQLLVFSRREVLTPEVIDINDCIDEFEGLLTRSFYGNVRIEKKLESPLWKTRLDPGRLENALLNLAVNARDAMPDGGRLILQTANVELDESYAARHPDVMPGAYVLLAVADTGHGMTKEVLSRAFEAFYTTKRAGAGTGLGLSMVYGFVRQSGGHISIYSTLKRGTTVKMYFPREEADEETASCHKPAAGTLPEGREAVLVVEDDADVREMTEHLLKSLGYRVLAASETAEAERLAEANGTIDLLFTDVVLAGDDTGFDLAERLRRRHPGLKVLFTSGHAEDTILHRRAEMPESAWLMKPFSREALARILREVLDGDGSLIPPG